MPLARSNHTEPEPVRLRLNRLFDTQHAVAPDTTTPDATASDATAPDTPPDDAAPAHASAVSAHSGPGGTPLSERIAVAFGLRGARIDPGGAGTRAIAAVALLVMLAAAGIAWWSAPRPEQIAGPAPAPTPARPSASATDVVVAVAGKVRRPGLVTLPAGARVADAIEAAGGVLPGTEVGYLNLARKLTDGELVVVGETPPPAAPGDHAPPGAPGAKVNLNTATQQQLDTLPGVGPVLAQRILDYRDRHGGFRSVDELRKVDGIGPARYEELKGLVTV